MDLLALYEMPFTSSSPPLLSLRAIDKSLIARSNSPLAMASTNLFSERISLWKYVGCEPIRTMNVSLNSSFNLLAVCRSLIIEGVEHSMAISSGLISFAFSMKACTERSSATPSMKCTSIPAFSSMATAYAKYIGYSRYLSLRRCGHLTSDLAPYPGPGHGGFVTSTFILFTFTAFAKTIFLKRL